MPRQVLALLAPALAALTTPAWALTLAPGQANFGLPGTNPIATPAIEGQVIATQIQHFALTLSHTSTGLSGTLTNTVVRENATNALDFYYQIALDTPAGGAPLLPPDFMLGSVTTSGFGAHTTDLYYRNDGTGIFPVFPRRSADGSTIVFGFTFGLLTNNILPGESTAPFFIRTNATDFARTGFTSPDFAFGTPSGTGTFDAVELPTFAPVPEPAALALLPLALVPLVLRCRR